MSADTRAAILEKISALTALENLENWTEAEPMLPALRRNSLPLQNQQRHSLSRQDKLGRRPALFHVNCFRLSQFG